jgi:hypothetical protein
MIPDIEVFKTSVDIVSEADRITNMIVEAYPSYRVTFDLQDCDRVLRVENIYGPVERDAVHYLVTAVGYHCEVLQD